MAKAAKAVQTSAERRPKLAGRSLKAGNVTLTPAEPAARLALRAPQASIAALSKALGVTLPQTPKSSAVSKDGARTALWLGPDEWLIVAPDGTDLAGEAAGAGALHAAVDIAHRNAAILVEGAGAQACLAAGCPQDLSPAAFPVGAVSRTVFGKAEIVLVRTGEDAFRVEVWRSFADYAWTLLAEAARDAGQ
ncbi:sarcosine oxidase subunit gamma [Mesorhizobium xinjiangense]|uniref:sarcosine oxidase subunit gamma n=1 Tax=Mesorhizobium xinjiangense TaxID=2678685 RepID=UPI0012EED359|nr:sarcosine oxidase subunit gamma [Mesorhizobium xinjiangense]